MKPQISIIATTYNQASDLELYLETLSRQTFADMEILIADDGSQENTRGVIERFKAQHFQDRLIHIWHEDLGYRKSKILNMAIRQARADWVLFTDTDLILHPRFVEDHWAMRAPNRLFMGRRINLGPRVSDWIRRNKGSLFSSKFYAKIVKSAFDRDATPGVKRAFRITHPLLGRALRVHSVPDLLGSNFSMDRNLLFKINGFDEGLEHYWGEDGDLFIRVRNSGAEILGRKNYAIQFHLWHRQREPMPGAETAYRKNLVDRSYVRCENGLDFPSPPSPLHAG